MSESLDDRTEAPTPRRLSEARKKGQVVVSRDLAAALGLVCAAMAFTVAGPWLVAGLQSALGRSLGSIHHMTETSASNAAITLGWSMLGPAAPLILFVIAAAVAASVVQTGFVFTGETLRLRAERLNPVEGLKRAFSLRTFIGIAGGLAKGAVIFGVLAALLWQERATLAGLSARELPEALGVFTGTAASLFGKTALALVALGFIDWAYRRWQHHRDLRMSRREIQDELREFEGDPAIRNRRRAHHAHLEETRFLGRVPASAVIVTDAGDTAVALGLEGETLRIHALGRGATADRIRESALQHGIPVLERSDLARALHRRGAAGGPVPPGLQDGAIDAVAVARDMKGPV